MVNPERKVPNQENTPERSVREWLILVFLKKVLINS
jgi:hypothetical protein